VDSKNITAIRSGQSFFKIHGLPEEDFPALPKFEDCKIFTLKQSELKDALKKTSYAISTDETRYVLNGILFSFKESRLTMVATDGRRLALIDLEVEFPQSEETEVIVPTKCINELVRLVGDTGELKMYVSQNQVAFDVGSTRLVSKLVEGNYPNYRQVIPPRSRSGSPSNAPSFWRRSTASPCSPARRAIP
jgi:DNA polymerase III subunit beta